MRADPGFGPALLVDGVVVVGAQGLLEVPLGLREVDVLGQVGLLGEDAHPVVGHRQEPAVDDRDDRVAGLLADAATAPFTSVPSSGAWCGRMPTSPSVVRARTMVASPVHTVRSAATSSTLS